MEDDKWRGVIDGTASKQTSNDWYLRHWKRYGSARWIKWKQICYVITAFAAAQAVDYIFIFCPHWSSSISLSFTYWFCIIWGWTYEFFVPLFIFYFIFRYISVLNDAIGLRKEVKVIAIMYFVINIISIIKLVMYRLIPIFHRDFSNYWPIIHFFCESLRRISFCPINYIQTRWVVGRLEHRYRLSDEFGSSNAIILSSTRTWKKVESSRSNLLKDQSDQNYLDSLDVDDEREIWEMHRTLKAYIAFQRFMRHLVKVHSVFSGLIHVQLICTFWMFPLPTL